MIAIADVAGGKPKILTEMPSKNCYGPVWSADGQRLLFNILAEEDWQLGLVNADGTGFSFAKKAEPKGHSFYSPAWAPDGKSFYCQDMDFIYQCQLDGTVLKKWKVSEVLPGGSFSSGAQLSVSPDGSTLLTDADMDEDVTRKNWDGPPPAIWSIDLATGKATRLSAKGVFAWQPRWIGADEYLFISQAANENEASIYRTKVGAKEKKLVVKNSRTPSASH